ncbi:MAG: hypothetical protein QJT81_02115 [Candidatus Thiothrix putei]|uniref:Uncharacterized protein n=1 Tax=Candidatus Thiothrix putei TaxID=3080811 RepID=A0AA95HHQ4_9GAMM|nr:MAG: hypothetical protein QJT81_02115 [Candidatus Thiothrix putei]
MSCKWWIARKAFNPLSPTLNSLHGNAISTTASIWLNRQLQSACFHHHPNGGHECKRLCQFGSLRRFHQDNQQRYGANAQAGNLKLYFEGSSSQWWTAVQVRDHRYPIAKLEARLSGSSNAYTSVARESHNYFVAPSGLGSGPCDFRITDFWGQTVEIKAIQLMPGVELDSGTQFEVYDAATPANNSSTAAVSTAANTSSNGGSGATDWMILLLLGGLVARRLQRG